MVKNIIPKPIHYLFYFVLGFFLFTNFLGLLFALTSYFFLLWFFRVKRLNGEVPGPSEDLIFSPIWGKVHSIERGVSFNGLGDDLIRVRLTLGPLGPFGVYLPLNGEIRDIFSIPGEGFFRFSKNEVEITKVEALHVLIEESRGDLIGLSMINCPMGGRPKSWLGPGDRGDAGALIGVWPFGGSVFLYLPAFYEIMVRPQDRVIPGETLIAGAVGRSQN
jgi:phosphatidylserine decarboxylase